MKYKYVKDLMTNSVIHCNNDTTIKNVIKLMKDHNIGFIPITKSNILIGVITDRDILIRGVGIYNLNDKIEKIMTSGQIFFTDPESSLIDAAKIMAENKIRRLVVLNDGKIAGIITTKNIIKEETLLPYVIQTYLPNKTIPEYSLYENCNPHDSIKASDFPL